MAQPKGGFLRSIKIIPFPVTSIIISTVRSGFRYNRTTSPHLGQRSSTLGQRSPASLIRDLPETESDSPQRHRGHRATLGRNQKTKSDSPQITQIPQVRAIVKREAGSG